MEVMQVDWGLLPERSRFCILTLVLNLFHFNLGKIAKCSSVKSVIFLILNDRLKEVGSLKGKSVG